MGNKDTNLIALNKSLKTPANVEEFAGVLIDKGVLDKPALKAVDVKAKSEFFKQFMACAFSSKDAEKKDAIVLGKFHFLKKSKAKSDIDNFVSSAASVAQEIKTHATQNPDDKQSVKKSAFFCGILESVGSKIEPLPDEGTPPPPPPPPPTEDSGDTQKKAKLEKELKSLGDETKLAKNLSEAGKMASIKHSQALAALNQSAPDLADVEASINEVKELLETHHKIKDLKERVSDLKAEVDVILTKNADNEAGKQSKAIIDKADDDLKGKSPDIKAIKSTLDQADKLLEENDEDDGESLMSLQEMKALLAKAAKADGSKSFPFACCEGGKHPDSNLTANDLTFVVHKRKKPSALMKNLKREIDSSKLKYGRFTIEKKAKTIVLAVEGELGSIPQIAKLMKLWLKEKKPLPVKKARIIDVGGNELSVGFEGGELKGLLVDYANRVTYALPNFLAYSGKIRAIWERVLTQAGQPKDFPTLSEDNSDSVADILAELDDLLDEAEGADAWEDVRGRVSGLYTTIEGLIKGKEPPYWGKLATAWKTAHNLIFSNCSHFYRVK